MIERMLLLIRKAKSLFYKFHPVRKTFGGGILPRWYAPDSAQYYGQDANDYVKKRIEDALINKESLFISKFGTTELAAVTFCKRSCNNKFTIRDYVDYTNCVGDISGENCLHKLCVLSGFFPKSTEMMYRFSDLVLRDMKDIDILGSYCKAEKYLKDELHKCIRIDIDGYLAPYRWKKPWSYALKGKRVLVIHPFVKSIQAQYNMRHFLFEDPEVLPEFGELICIKAVQSVAENTTEYDTWFDALSYMEKEIDKIDFDVALIGCGAYGMSLGAYVKRKGKIAIHLAGWTQNLFGIYGNRWINDMPEYMQYVNEYWKRPMENEKPFNADKVENACYW